MMDAPSLEVFLSLVNVESFSSKSNWGPLMGLHLYHLVTVDSKS
jgi:hypothetical protein